MTTREFLNAVISANVNDELTAKARELITKADARNASRRTRPSKTQVENAPIVNAIATILTAEPQLTTAIAAQVGASSQKVAGLLTQMKNAGQVSQTEISVKGKGKQKGWFIPSAPSAE